MDIKSVEFMFQMADYREGFQKGKEKYGNIQVWLAGEILLELL